jgi:hypothetical protein
VRGARGAAASRAAAACAHLRRAPGRCSPPLTAARPCPRRLPPPPAEIPAALVGAGADLEARDAGGMTALQVSLLAGWQNIAELLIKSGASTAGVAAIKGRLTCPDCKRLVAQYKL